MMVFVRLWLSGSPNLLDLICWKLIPHFGRFVPLFPVWVAFWPPHIEKIFVLHQSLHEIFRKFCWFSDLEVAMRLQSSRKFTKSSNLWIRVRKSTSNPTLKDSITNGWEFPESRNPEQTQFSPENLLKLTCVEGYPQNPTFVDSYSMSDFRKSEDRNGR